MGHVEVAHVHHALPDGRVLLDDASFRVGEGTVAALVGPNGSGKTTLIRLIAGDVTPQSGTVTTSGGLGVMRQFIGGIRGRPRVEHSIGGSGGCPPGRAQRRGDPRGRCPDRARSRAARRGASGPRPAGLRCGKKGARGRSAAGRGGTRDDGARRRAGPAAVRGALAEWGDAAATTPRCSGTPARSPRSASRSSRPSGGRCARCPAASRSGWCWRRCCAARTRCCCSTSRTTTWTCRASAGWRSSSPRRQKTVLLVSHDRELLANCAERIITVEDGNVWVHGGGFASYAQARRDRNDRLDELRRRWDEEHEKLKQLVRMYRQKATYNDAMASRLQAAGDPAAPVRGGRAAGAGAREQNVRMRLRGGRTGKRAVICEDLELTGLMQPFDLEVWYGERVAVLGSNGSGKSHFLRLLAGGAGVAHEGVARLGARVVPGLFAQTHTRPDLAGRWPEEILMTEHALARNEAMAALSRYELQSCAEQPFGTLSGGQQARLQILLLELSRVTAAAARRADRQPRPGQCRGTPGGSRVLSGHGAGGHARPLVRAVIRPFPRLRGGRGRVRIRRPGVG